MNSTKNAALKASEKKAYPLRIDPTVFELVKERSLQDGRSVNKQIEFLLRQALKPKNIK